MKIMWRVIGMVCAISMICCLFAACGEDVDDYPEMIIGTWEPCEQTTSDRGREKISGSKAKKERITFLPDGSCVHSEVVKYWVNGEKLTYLTDGNNYFEYTILHLDEEELTIKMTNGDYWVEGTLKKVK